MTVSEARHWLEQTLSGAGIESANAEARWLLEHLFVTTLAQDKSTPTFQQGGYLERKSNGIPLLTVSFEPHQLTQEQKTILTSWLERRTKREPLQHILGIAPFYGLELFVTPDVLIPRPETERLVEIVLESIKHLTKPRVLDIGTGSGAIALTIKHERPDVFIMATDISANALAVAKQNAEKYGLDVTFLESDLLHNAEVQRFAKECNVLVANLPYLPQSDKNLISPEVLHDPDLALYAGSDGLDVFQRLEQQAFEFIQTSTHCFFELDPRNIQTAFELSLHWETREVLEDLVRRERFLKLGKNFKSSRDAEQH
jgi:release factor glutamine methyltransferase